MKILITEIQSKKIMTYCRINENVQGFDPQKSKIDVNGNLIYDGKIYKIFTDGRERFFEYFNFDGNTLKMKFKDGKPQEYSTSNWIWGGKIEYIIGGLVNGLKKISVLGGKLLLQQMI